MNDPRAAARSGPGTPRGLVLAAALLAGVLVPWAAPKLALFATALAVLSFGTHTPVSISSGAVGRALIAAAWTLFVVTPYWMLPRGWPVRLLALAASALLAHGWSRIARDAVRVPAQRAPLAAFATLAVVELAWTWGALRGPIEFRGDEDYHMAPPLAVLTTLWGRSSTSPRLAALLLCAIVIGALAWRSLRRLLAGAWIALPAALLVYFWKNPMADVLLQRLVRFPSASSWLHVAAAVSPLHAAAASRAVFQDEALFRLVPVLSWLGLGFWLLRGSRGLRWVRLGVALLVITTPAATYYATSLYPEPSAAALVTIGLWGIDRSARRALTGRAGFRLPAVALALGALLKESFVPTAAAAVACYWAWSFSTGRVRATWVGRARLAAVVLGPAFLYLAWRFGAPLFLGAAGVTRPFSVPSMAPLPNPELYAILGRATSEQFAGLLAAALLGLGLASRRNAWRAGAWTLALLLQLAVLGTDHVRSTALGPLPAYWGYSRYFLTLMPPLICLALLGLRASALRWRALTAAALAGGLAWNVAARPLAWDGSRIPFWGDYVVETSGERYPYDELYAWLARNGELRDVTIVGRDYDYPDGFYREKHGLRSRVSAPAAQVPRSALVAAGGPARGALLDAHREALEAAVDAPGPVVLHVSAWLDANELPRELGPLHAVRDFRLGRHTLLLYDANRDAATSR